MNQKTAPSAKDQFMRRTLPKIIRPAYSFLSAPLSILLLTYSVKVRPRYNMGWHKRILLGFRFWINNMRIKSGTSWRAHLVIAMKLLEMPANRQGAVVECGCFKGGASVNLSLVCNIIGRPLKIYDSFEGLPPPVEGDYTGDTRRPERWVPYVYAGNLDEVKGNIRRLGAIEACEFHKGLFKDTLGDHEGAIVAAYFDVDYCSSLHDCLTNLWPHIVDEGYVFLDEYRNVAYSSVFFLEKYWRKYFQEDPPGLIGIGTGVQVGMHYTDASSKPGSAGRIQTPESVAYTIKGSRAMWDYYPDEMAAQSEASLGEGA